MTRATPVEGMIGYIPRLREDAVNAAYHDVPLSQVPTDELQAAIATAIAPPTPR